jgi:hypothetical protein
LHVERLQRVLQHAAYKADPIRPYPSQACSRAFQAYAYCRHVCELVHECVE